MTPSQKPLPERLRHFNGKDCTCGICAAAREAAARIEALEAQVAGMRNALEQAKNSCGGMALYYSANHISEETSKHFAEIFSGIDTALRSTAPSDLVCVPRKTLEWIRDKTKDKRNPAVAFVAQKLLDGDDFSPLRDDAALSPGAR